MGSAEKAAAKRIGRTLLSVIIAGTLAYTQANPALLVLAPVISGVAKWLREKFSLRFIPL